MDSTLGIVVVAGVIGVLLAAAAYRYVVQRRQLSSGSEVGCFRPRERDGYHVFDNEVEIQAAGKWCRLVLRFKARLSRDIDLTVKKLSKRVALVIGTPYSLVISNVAGDVLYRERASLGRFTMWFASSGRGTETMFRDRGRGIQQGEITLLEFSPRDVGSYRVLLQLRSRVEDCAEGSKSDWEVFDAELTLMEDVIPLSTSVSYPHKRVHF